MPNQTNYVEDITPFLNGQSIQIGDSVFRFALPTDNIISDVIDNGEIGVDSQKDNLEIHLYTRDSNELVKSARIPLNEGLLYIRNEFRNDIIQFGLEMWNPERPEDSLIVKYLPDVPAGYYNVVINFFSDELGSLNNVNWQISEISPSRTELLIEPIGEVDDAQYDQFAQDSIHIEEFSRIWATLFDKDKDPDEFFTTLKQGFFNTLNESARNYITAESSSYKNQISIGLNAIFEEIFNNLREYTREQLAQFGKFRVTENEFKLVLRNITTEAVRNNLDLLPDSNIIMRAE